MKSCRNHHGQFFARGPCQQVIIYTKAIETFADFWSPGGIHTCLYMSCEALFASNHSQHHGIRSHIFVYYSNLYDVCDNESYIYIYIYIYIYPLSHALPKPPPCQMALVSYVFDICITLATILVSFWDHWALFWEHGA